eukprot:TRINITY_DN158733_c0_g1_i2.p1 TRINITY_DN158733_c0_g1~~TRINITY_DN158733_c0_g1_i2.p1  ORF type:complete len:363 (-),score=70.18 TRINITY_DN158733_c0_g1_i2:93-1181(-)
MSASRGSFVTNTRTKAQTKPRIISRVSDNPISMDFTLLPEEKPEEITEDFLEDDRINIVPLIHNKILGNKSTKAFQETLLAFRGHFISQRSLDEGANWGCGYCNISMLSAAIMDNTFLSKHLFPTIDTKRVPTLWDIQESLDEMWKSGIDPKGRLGGPHGFLGTTGRSAWIGVSDFAFLLGTFQIPYELHQFTCKDVQRKQRSVVETVWNYFATGEMLEHSNDDSDQIRVKVTSRFPIMFQWAGHSISILGIERKLKKGKRKPIENKKRKREEMEMKTRDAMWSTFLQTPIGDMEMGSENSITSVNESSVPKDQSSELLSSSNFDDYEYVFIVMDPGRKDHDVHASLTSENVSHMVWFGVVW